MHKDFDTWNQEKKRIHSEGESKFYHPREIWWCSMGVNVGVEADGKGEEYRRPVVILKGFNLQSFLGVALTGKKREGKYYLYLGKISGREASANLSQIRLLDTKRLVRKIGMLDKTYHNELLERVVALIK